MTRYDWNGTGFPKTLVFSSNDADELAHRSSKVNQIPSLTTEMIKSLSAEDLKPLNHETTKWDHYSGLPSTSSYDKSEPLTYREIDKLYENHRWNKIEYNFFVALIREVESIHGIKTKNTRYG